MKSTPPRKPQSLKIEADLHEFGIISLSLAYEIRMIRHVYRDVTLRDVGSAWLRRIGLSGSKLLPRRESASPHDRPRVVISLTTIPSRIGRICRVVNSLIDQTSPADEIVLAIPAHSRRERVEYRIPNSLTSSSAVTIIRCDDLGPATKLLPTLEREQDPQSLVVAVDDDTVYPPEFIETLVHWHRLYPDHVLGYRGWRVPKSMLWNDAEFVYGTRIRSPEPADIVTGVWGLAVQPRFFDRGVFDVAAQTPEAFFVDDVWFNGHLARCGVPRLVIPCRRPPMSSILTSVNGLAYGVNRSGRNDEAAMRCFADHWDFAQRSASIHEAK